MGFPWMAPTQHRRESTAQRLAMYKQELADRAGLFYRLGYPASRAATRLKANVAWDFEIGTGGRPAELGDRAIEEIVHSTYRRRPAR